MEGNFDASLLRDNGVTIVVGCVGQTLAEDADGETTVEDVDKETIVEHSFTNSDSDL